MKIKIYYDGVNIKKYIDRVEGVTTNTSYIAGAGISDYNLFIDESLKAVGTKPISFQVTEPSLAEIEKQAKYLSSKGDNVYVKIPIVLPNGRSTKDLIKKLSAEGMKVNVTCIHTTAQVIEACDATLEDSPSIISLFAGGVSDSGNSPKKMFDLTFEATKDNPNKEILYAGCQRVYSLVEAKEWNSDIITVPDGVMEKFKRMKINELETSIKKSELFFKDGSKLKLEI